jgi:hypothetical protein
VLMRLASPPRQAAALRSPIRPSRDKYGVIRDVYDDGPRSRCRPGPDALAGSADRPAEVQPPS